jgi:hypothetical protein
VQATTSTAEPTPFTLEDSQISPLLFDAEVEEVFPALPSGTWMPSRRSTARITET